MDWSDEQIEGQYRFLGRLTRLFSGALTKLGKEGLSAARAACEAKQISASGTLLELRRRTHKTIARVTQQLERLQFNTAISSLMELSNAAAEIDASAVEAQAPLYECLASLAQMLAPFAPHAAEELWAALHAGAVESEKGAPELSLLAWPSADAALVADDVFQIAVQVNGKLRGEVQVPAGASDDEVREAASLDPKVRTWIAGKAIKKVVVIPKRLVNFVVVG
jgi:leucyl-tRNA synthetase